jgi:hypothetical protein
MPNIRQTISETELSHATALDRRQIPIELYAAGLSPTKATVRGNSVDRRWPRVAALEVLRSSEAKAIKKWRDIDAANRAAIMTLRMSIKAGTHTPFEVWALRFDRYLYATVALIERQAPQRYAPEVAEVNRRGLPELERRAELRRVFEPMLAEVRRAKEMLLHD